MGELQPCRWEVRLALPPARGLPVLLWAAVDSPAPGTSTGQVEKR